MSANRITATLATATLTWVMSSMSPAMADELAMNDRGAMVITPAQRIGSMPSDNASAPKIQGVVRDEIAKKASQHFQEGGLFYIYRDSDETLRGHGAVTASIRYLKDSSATQGAVKIYAYITTRGIYGEIRRFGVTGGTSTCSDAGGELRVGFSGKFKSCLSHATTTVSGKAMLHVVLLPADCDARKLNLGCTIPATSNTLLIPIDF